jgi:hypothetical protein
MKESMFDGDVEEQKSGRGEYDGGVILIKDMFVLKWVKTEDEVQGDKKFDNLSKSQ